MKVMTDTDRAGCSSHRVFPFQLDAATQRRMRQISAWGRLSKIPSSLPCVRLSIETNAKPMTSPDPLIEFRDVTYRVPLMSRHALVSNISFAVRPAETLVLLGRSGSGKTTVLKLINRLLLPSAGQVLVSGRSTSDWDPIRLRRGIGYVIQEVGLFPHFSVAENIGLVPALEKWDAVRISSRVDELSRLVGLDPAEFSARRPRELSGGQRQRVGVARALAANPPILLMDEPFGALDPVTRAELQREFSALARRLGKTIVFVTHDLREALLLASRIALLEAGRIVAIGTPEEFLQLDLPEVRAFTSSLIDPAAAQPGASS
jgi:osmoprotectant transport system ATP-binding protein